MSNKINPYIFVIFFAVVGLILSFSGYRARGSSMLFLIEFLLLAAIGMFAGLNWRVYPWQVGLAGLIPSLIFLLWRFYSAADPVEMGLNSSLFVFLPVISLVGAYVGAYLGRRISHRRRKQAGSNEQKAS